MYIEYESNNSGGSWWLGDSHWRALEAAGWKVLWASLEEKYTAKGYECDVDGTPLLVPISDSSLEGSMVRKGADGEYRFLGALATHAFRAGLSLREAVDEWERVTGMDATAEGCECCGRPHVFAEYDDTGGAMELVLIRGLPGSGKTTMARVLAMVGYEHHEADHYFERGGIYRFDPAELPKAHAWCLERATNSIARGVRCVVANTFTQRWEMQPYMDAAHAAGVAVRVIEARGEWENCHGVPTDAIERMRSRWETVEVVSA